MRFKTILPALLAMALLTVNSYAADKYEIDKNHSAIGFTVRHMVIAKVTGKFKEVSGTILYDAQDVTESSVNVVIKTASIDTDNESRDNHLRSGDFFDSSVDSLITFASKKIEKKNDGFVAVGDFTLRGVTKEISIFFKILGTVKDQRGDTRLGIEANLTINRFDYGVKWDRKFDETSLVVGELVDINLLIEAVSKKE